MNKNSDTSLVIVLTESDYEDEIVSDIEYESEESEETDLEDNTEPIIPFNF